MMKLKIYRLSQKLIPKYARHNSKGAYQLVLYFYFTILQNLKKKFYIFPLTITVHASQRWALINMSVSSFIIFFYRLFQQYLFLISWLCRLSDITMTKHWGWNMITLYWSLSLKSLIHPSNVFQILLHSFSPILSKKF